MSSVALPGQPLRVRRKTWMLAAGAALSVAAIAGGAHWWLTGRFFQSTDDAYVRADTVTVSPRVAGYVSQVVVDDNQRVKHGDVLVQLDDRDYRARVTRAQAAVQAATADVQAQTDAAATLDAELTRQRSVIAQAQAEVAGASAEARRQTADAARYRDLLSDGAASQQRWEQAAAEASKALSALARTRAAGDTQVAQQTVLARRREQSKAAIAQAQAQLTAAQAALVLAENDLVHTTVRASRDGTVGQRTVRAGQYVETGTPLLALVPLDDVYVVANFKETQITRMQPGQPVDIDIDAFPEHALHGRVTGFAPGSGAEFALLPPDNATGNFTKIVQRIPVKIRLDRTQNGGRGVPALRPGMSVIARVDTRSDSRPDQQSDKGAAQ
ncbi:HlyD family secretion protein [Pandoraea norimbergensis]|uniref:Hemolysin D n=1 Tax=Pandoraea norimbergensis TaxID=93219 RepID=A0ABM5WLP5_9BURK|nr:HlyD family secretion protein [Pandoraea norimbergensis]ALS61294.1 hemolysin D [Pandoraea norimbergensis]